MTIVGRGLGRTSPVATFGYGRIGALRLSVRRGELGVPLVLRGRLAPGTVRALLESSAVRDRSVPSSSVQVGQNERSRTEP